MYAVITVRTNSGVNEVVRTISEEMYQTIRDALIAQSFDHERRRLEYARNAKLEEEARDQADKVLELLPEVSEIP